MNAQQYYAQPDIRHRIIEFLGGKTLNEATCVFIAHGAVGKSRRIFPLPIQELDLLLDKGLDIARSLWDSESLLVHLDIEYVNFDYPAEPYLDYARSFRLQQPAIDIILNTLSSFGIVPLHLLSGRGHHLVWRIGRDSPAFDELYRIGKLPLGLESYYALNPVLPDRTVEPELGKAYVGLGMLLEYLTNRAIKEGGPNCEIPITISDIEVVPQKRGRETISIDISEYSDPLSTRMIRTAFSVYTKPIRLEDENVPQLLFFVPLKNSTIEEGISIMKDPQKACSLASDVSTEIPDLTNETLKFIADYESSKLARFHHYYYSVDQEMPSRWHGTYDKFPLDKFPKCIQNILSHPGKILLRPAVIQLVVRTLYASGWHPQHIAGLIRSKFERNYEWGGEWEFYNPAARTDFYVRALAGAIATGTDTLNDFTCADTKKKGFCLENCASDEMHRPHQFFLQYFSNRKENFMNKSTVGLSTGCFYRSDIFNNIEKITNAGFTILEISSSASHIDIYNLKQIQELMKYLKSKKVDAYSFHAPFAKNIDITSPDPDERKYSHETILQSLKAASVLKVQNFVLHPWPEKEFPTHSPEKKVRKNNANEFIRILAQKCMDNNITLALENMQPQLLISPMKDLFWIKKETEIPDVAACFDTGHAFLTKSFSIALHELAGHIEMVHVSDNWGQKDDHLPPGKGAIDWRRFIADLLRTGFKGSFIIELDDKEGADPASVIRDAAEGKEYLSHIINDIGADFL